MTNKSNVEINRDFVGQVGGHILATQLAAMRDPGEVQDYHLDRLADVSVRAAIAIEAAIPRAEERIAAEAKAASDKAVADAAAVVAAEKAAAAAANAAAKEAAKAEK